jgi:post-segregation antitoxin (ccd killing protein)
MPPTDTPAPAILDAEKSNDIRNWFDENAEAIAYQNRLVAEEGAFGDDVRSF